MSKAAMAFALLLSTFILYTLAFYKIIDPENRILVFLSCLSPVIASSMALAFIFALFNRLRKGEVQRRIWMLFAVATALNLAAETIFMILQGVLGKEEISLLPDVFWLASYPFFLAGLLILILGYHRLGLEFKTKAVGPVLVFIIVALVLVTIFLVLPVVSDESASLTEKLINPAYAYLDLLILIPSFILALSFFGGWQGRAWSLISASFILISLADMVYVYLDWNGLYGAFNHLDLLWVAGYLILGLAAGWQDFILEKASHNP